MARSMETSSAILDSAQRLMALHGIKGVSLRQVLREAGVNLALAHYHFGNREGVVEAVLRRPAEALRSTWERALDELEAQPASRIDPRRVLEALFQPVVELSLKEPDAASLICQLLASPDLETQRMAKKLFNGVLTRFTEVLRRSIARSPRDRSFRVRVELLTGALIILLVRSNPMASIPPGDLDVVRARTLLVEIVSFCLAGLTGGRELGADRIRKA
jgi:AcrR family transcriptional regulator